MRNLLRTAALAVPQIRRLFDQRNQAIRERDAALAELRTSARAAEVTTGGEAFLGRVPERYARNRDRYRSAGGFVNPAEDIALYQDNDFVRFFFLSLIFDQLSKEGTIGDVLELGVWKGNTAVLLANFARRMNVSVYLLDTYTGFDERDLGNRETHMKGVFSDTSLEAVRARIGENGVHYIKGYFPETARQLPSDKLYSLVHIDCDLYAPVRSALEYFYPRMVEGGFMVLHDYTSLSWEGPEKAVDEFLADKPESVVPMPDYAGSVVLRKAKRGSARQ